MISKKVKKEILDLCSNIDNIISDSSKSKSPQDVICSLNAIRGLLPTLGHKLAAVDALVLQIERSLLDDEYWKQIKNSSTMVKDFAINKYPDVRDCKLRLEYCFKVVQLASTQLTTELSYYKVELQNVG